MSISIDSGDIIAGLAFLLSAYATWMTFRFNERQKSLIVSQEKLNNLLVEKESLQVENEKKADLGATFIKLGSNKHRLKIWNKGKTTARNVKIEFPEGNDIVMQSDVDEKFPLESLDTFQAVELLAIVHMGSKSKHIVRLVWSDDLNEYNEKIVYPTL